jgi:hypothetical protein
MASSLLNAVATIGRVSAWPRAWYLGEPRTRGRRGIGLLGVTSEVPVDRCAADAERLGDLRGLSPRARLFPVAQDDDVAVIGDEDVGSRRPRRLGAGGAVVCVLGGCYGNARNNGAKSTGTL